MNTFEYLQALEAVTAEQLAKQAISDNTQLLADIQRAQLKTGYNAENKPIGAYRNKRYERYKMQKNPEANGRVDLILTGAFSGSITVKSDNNDLNFNADDPKADDLITKYNKNGLVFGINQSSIDTNKDKLTEILIETYQKTIGK